MNTLCAIPFRRQARSGKSCLVFFPWELLTGLQLCPCTSPPFITFPQGYSRLWLLWSSFFSPVSFLSPSYWLTHTNLTNLPMCYNNSHLKHKNSLLISQPPPATTVFLCPSCSPFSFTAKLCKGVLATHWLHLLAFHSLLNQLREGLCPQALSSLWLWPRTTSFSPDSMARPSGTWPVHTVGSGGPPSPLPTFSCCPLPTPAFSFTSLVTLLQSPSMALFQPLYVVVARTQSSSLLSLPAIHFC